jgi:hypothetical protein
MNTKFENDICAARDVNERAAAYAGEIIRVQQANAVLTTAASNLVRFMRDGLTEDEEESRKYLKISYGEWREALVRDLERAIAKQAGG